MQKMDRGKRAVMFEYLPGKTYDFARTGVIAKTSYIHGRENVELNHDLVLYAVSESVEGWTNESHRPLFRLRSHRIERPDRFVLIEPRRVEAEMFPLVFWCQNPLCNRVFEMPNTIPNSKICPECHSGRLVQLRWVRVHRCGSLKSLTPYCTNCHSRTNIRLVTRGSERIRDFRWVCDRCGTSSPLFGGKCQECNWQDPIPNVNNPANMNIEVHRAGRTFYPHHVVLLNQPTRELDRFLRTDNWQSIVAASFLGFEEIGSRQLVSFARRPAQGESHLGLSSQDRELLRSEGHSDVQIEAFEQMQAQLFEGQQDQISHITPERVAELLVSRTRIPLETWNHCGYELLEAIIPYQTGTVRRLFDDNPGFDEPEHSREWAQRIGVSCVDLITDFPITTAVFGYSRTDYRPGFCYLNAFPPDREHEGRFPIYVDTVHADALMLRLNPRRVARWLESNRFISNCELSEQSQINIQSYFIQLLNDVPLRQTIQATQPQARMVFGLLHTLSHIGIRQAALLCGLDRTSLSEYILPRALSFAIYSSHRFGATIGAFTALYEQSLSEWFDLIHNSRRCVYDPVCANHGGNCHACTHVAEISCQYFNLNLGRVFLFGGQDQELGTIEIGYFDPALN